MTQTNNEREALRKIMKQVQVYASSYSLVGTRFASDNQLEEADSEKLSLYNMVKSVLSQSPISQNERQEAVYFYREKDGTVVLGEVSYTGWYECDEDWYKECQKEQHGDYYQVRKLYTSPPKQAIPEGWKLSPIEPTDEMCIKAREVTGISSNAARHVFISMINEAPTNTEVGE